MADIVDVSTQVIVQGAVVRGRVLRLWKWIALAAVLLLSIFMNFFQLGQGSYGNLYYAAGVRSMLDSLHNFFFVAYDPGGFVAVDKPPLGFWLQAVSAKIFGFTPFSIFLPQALCGVLAVLLLYFLVRRHFGIIAGLGAALALAVTPISVVTNRNNTIDSTLALALLLAAWAMIHAAERGKLRWLLLSAVFVGLGFNIKMSEAYLVLPALFMTYLLCAPRRWQTRAWHLALFVVVVFALSLSWVVAVDRVAPDQRPYVGSTQNNSEVSLAFGYNGLNRLHSGGDFSEAGAPSIFHLFSVSLGGQIAWLLPFALFGVLALAWQGRPDFQRDRQQLALVLWGLWLLTMATLFTLDSPFHQYYMTELAPGLSAMVGIGLVVMWRDYRGHGWRGWLLPLALAVTAASQLYMLASFPAWASWLSPLIGVLAVLTVLILILLRLRPHSRWVESMSRVSVIAIGWGMFALLIAPTLWSCYSVLHNTESSAPAAGPPLTVNTGIITTWGRTGSSSTDANEAQSILARIASAFGLGGFSGGTTNRANEELISYLEAHQGNTKFFVATLSSSAASPIILAINKPVMALGGFNGNDPILTINQLQALINHGTVRYFLLTSSSASQDLTNQYRNFAANRGRDQNAQLTSWVTSNCRAVPASDIQTSAKRSNLDSNQLYDCAPASP